VRDVLLGIHRGKEQHLGDFGFNVNHTPTASNAGASDGNAAPSSASDTPDTPEATT